MPRCSARSASWCSCSAITALSSTAVGETGGADQDQVGAQFRHDVELAVRPAQVERELVGIGGVQVPERLVEVDRQAQVRASPPHVGAPTRRTRRDPARRSPRRRTRPPTRRPACPPGCPEMHTVAMAVRSGGRGVAGPTTAVVAGTGADPASSDIIASRVGDPQRIPVRRRFGTAAMAGVPTSGRPSRPARRSPRRRQRMGDMAPELPEALRDVAERAASVLAPETDIFEDVDVAGSRESLVKARPVVGDPAGRAGQVGACTWPATW